MENEDQYIINLIKLSELTLTNKEHIFLSNSNIKYSVDSCSDKLKNKIKDKGLSEFLSCIGKIVCPNEYFGFTQCMAESKGLLEQCLTQFHHLDLVMKRKVNESIYEIDDIKL